MILNYQLVNHTLDLVQALKCHSPKTLWTRSKPFKCTRIRAYLAQSARNQVHRGVNPYVFPTFRTEFFVNLHV